MKNKKLLIGILAAVVIVGVSLFVFERYGILKPEVLPTSVPIPEVTITTDKKEYEQGEEINASLSYDTTIYAWEGYEWSIQKWEDDSWVTIKRKEDRYFVCANVLECKDVNLVKIEECPPMVLCERPIWYEVKDTPKLVWDQSYKIEEKTFQCKTGRIERVETWPCVIFGQVSSGKYKIRFEYTLAIDPNDPFNRNVEIKYAEKEFKIK